MVDGRGGFHAGNGGYALQEVVAGRHSGRRGDGHVGTKRELSVDVRLLVIGRAEHAEVDTERKQQPDDDQAPVDRSAAAAGARENEARSRAGALAGGTPRRPADRAATQTDEQ